MSNVERPSDIPFPQAARVCAKWIAIVLPLVIALLALVGKAIEEWDSLLWLASLGGHFWGAVAVGVTAFGFVAWASCVQFHLPRDSPKKITGSMVAIAVCAGSVLLLATIALHTVYDHFDALTVYQIIAVYSMRVGLGLGAVGAYFVAGVHAASDG